MATIRLVTVALTGVAAPRVPTILTDAEALNYNAKLSTPMTRTFKVNGLFLTNDITITLNDQNNVFTVSPTTISKNSTGIDEPVTVSVTFVSDVEGDFTGSLTLTSNGAETKTVALSAKATDKGTASDPYLDLAKYETIDEAGASVSGMTTIYNYTENEAEECAWLTLSNYGAMQADANQNWLETSSLSQYNNSWDASDVFLGDNAYFGNSSSYSIYGSGSQSFYVTTCTQVKALVKGSSYSGSSATLSIYECEVNANGVPVPATTATDTKSASNGVITSALLDESKIYKVQLNGGGSYPDLLEIGFKTPIGGVEVPVATAATLVGPTYFTANWNAVAGADSYTLRIVPKNYDILTEGFTAFTKAGSIDIGSNLDQYMDNAGWTGSKLYETVGGVRFGTGSSTGYLTSPGLTLTSDKVTVVFKAKAFNNDTNCNLKVSCGDSNETVTLPSNTEATYTVVLDCNAAAGQKIKFETVAAGKRAVITGIHVIDGERPATKSIDIDGITITGLTQNSYKVTDLDPATTYFYDVKAVMGGKESRWSNLITVTTLAGVIGDVNGDGEVTTVDITCIYNYLLNGDTTYIATSDVNGDGEITTVDVTVIYSILLSNKK